MELLVAEELNSSVEEIKDYIDKTKIGAIPIHPDSIIGPMPDLGVDWNWQHWAWLRGGQAVANWIHHWSGGMAVEARWWNKYGIHEVGSRRYNAAKPAAESNYRSAVNRYYAEKAAYDESVTRASSIQLSYTVFDNLVDKVNGWLKNS
jgi:hypothetical protein